MLRKGLEEVRYGLRRAGMNPRPSQIEQSRSSCNQELHCTVASMGRSQVVTSGIGLDQERCDTEPGHWHAECQETLSGRCGMTLSSWKRRKKLVEQFTISGPKNRRD